jgi:thymidylate synthase (FAD)
MKIIKPSVEIIKDKDPIAIYKSIEAAGRTCYKSEGKITEVSYIKFIQNVIKREHLSVIEHEKITARVICDRGVSHEIVRHRIGSYSQESTRYVNYKEGIEVIQPPIKDQVALAKWEASMIHAENTYRDMIMLGETPEIARAVLPTGLKTEIVITYNIREWRHFFKLRCATFSHPQIQEVAHMLLSEMEKYVPLLFEDLIRIHYEGIVKYENNR